MTDKTRVTGVKIEKVGKLRNYDVSYDIKELISVWEKSGIENILLTQDVTYDNTERVNHTHNMSFYIKIPFLKENILLVTETIQYTGHSAHSFFLYANEGTLYDTHAKCLLMYLKESFVYRRPFNMNHLKIDILRGKSFSEEELNDTV